MKTATIPALRVEPALREAAEQVLNENETLSSFVEEAIKSNIERRNHQQAFIARGIISRDESKAAQDYQSAESVLNDLNRMLKKAKQT